ncbi:MAG: hypothetical protein AMXMBFR56_18700 [Polyangiaceae bacterium]
MRWSMLVLTTSLCAAACGGGDGGGGGPPGAVGGSGGGGGALPDADLPENYAPEPGVCRPLCCADSDCGGTEKCEPFDPKAGTLGVCSAGWAGEAGTAAPDAGTPSFPQSCWTLTTPECNPLTNESCAAGGACDIGGMGDPDTKPVVACYYDDNTQGPGEVCDNVEGPFCVPGFHCVPK